MNICFVLPQMLKKPVGGYKIVYEYANRLSRKGYNVTILYLNENALRRFALPTVVRNLAVDYFTMSEPKWFSLDKKIKKISSTNKRKIKVLKSIDVAVATGADTVYKTLEMFEDSRKLYFIQDHETWLDSEDNINRTYALGFENIVISNWLKTIVDKHSNKSSILIKNPIDINIYRKKIEPCDRRKYDIGVLYHKAEHKGFKYAYEAIKKVKESFPELRLFMFGTSTPSFDLPDWVDFTLNASQQDTVRIYNKVSVFVCATVAEGYGLTGLEAMSCGAALASTSYDGVKEYAINGYNSLLSPIKNVELLTKNIINLIEDDSLRMTISHNGESSAKSFSWEKAIELFEECLNNSI